MNAPEIKKLLINSLHKDLEADKIARRLEEEGIGYSFSAGFTGRVLDRIFSADIKIAREIEFSKYLNIAFYRIALTGVAAIVLLLISLFLMEGSLSFNSFLGVTNAQDESIVCLLTGN